jgi:hypothetical protein
MENYNLAKPQEIKQALALRLEVLSNEKKALVFLQDALNNYKRKNIDKYFKDHAESLSPKYSVIWNERNPKTEKWEDITKVFPVYSISIQKDPVLYNKVNLYLHDNQAINGAENYLTFTFYPDYNATTEEEKQAKLNITPANLSALISRDIEINETTTAKVQKDYDDAEVITDIYNKARQNYDDILEKVHYYTRDQLTGKRDYNLSKRQ